MLLLLMQGAPFETELEYLAFSCQDDPLVQAAVLSFKQQTALKVTSVASSFTYTYLLFAVQYHEPQT